MKLGLHLALKLCNQRVNSIRKERKPKEKNEEQKGLPSSKLGGSQQGYVLIPNK